MKEVGANLTRNKRSVWTVSTKPYKDAHFATFPPDLITPCVLAGCPDGGVVLDPFAGSGTTGLVAMTYGRRFIGCELNPEYIKLAERRMESARAQELLPLNG
jgi:DNA modification methylase